MSTMDAVVAAGGAVSLSTGEQHTDPGASSLILTSTFTQPANFLDGGGGATAANAKVSIQVLAKDPDIKVIFVFVRLAWNAPFVC